MFHHSAAAGMPLAVTYASNALSIKLANARFIIQPTAQASTNVDAIPVSARSRLPLHLVSAWNPQGEPATFARNHLHQAELEDAVARRTHDWLRGTLIGAGNAWFEQTAAISGFTDKQAIALGKRFQQAAVIRVDADGWHILPTVLHDEIEPATLGWHIAQRIGRTCAMRVLDANSEPCRMDGGPYGSRAISAAADWTQRRKVACQLLGCYVCETRPTEPAEQGLILNPGKEWCVASRHGRAIVRDKARRKVDCTGNIEAER